MTNNTIPNVPRELLDSLLTVIESNGYAADEVEVVDELRALMSAPSPAGVDGWDVAGDILEKLSAAQAIIDGLRGEVERFTGLWEMELARAQKAENDAAHFALTIDQQAQRIGELASHLEFAVTMLTVAGLDGNAQVAAMRAALSASSAPQ